MKVLCSCFTILAPMSALAAAWGLGMSLLLAGSDALDFYCSSRAASNVPGRALNVVTPAGFRS